jgi:hypothetical protein
MLIALWIIAAALVWMEALSKRDVKGS